MNNFYKKYPNNIVEQMNVNYENYQNELNALNSAKAPENKGDKTASENSSNLLNNPLLTNIAGNNMANLLPLLSGNNFSNLPNKNELIMKLLSNMNNNNFQSQAKTLTSNKADIDNLVKVDDYDFL